MSARLSPRAVALLTHSVVLLVLVLVLVGLFGPVLWHPGRYLFSSAEDGLKNYYTSLWYVRHDAGLWFTGMSYPFGEHVVFNDNQPLLSFILAALQRRGVAVNTVAVFNGCMLGAQLLSAPPLLALLRRCRLPAASIHWTAVGAISCPSCWRRCRPRRRSRNKPGNPTHL